jgi:hypothetical protein
MNVKKALANKAFFCFAVWILQLPDMPRVQEDLLLISNNQPLQKVKYY